MRTKTRIKGAGWWERVSDHIKCHSENFKMIAQMNQKSEMNKRKVRDVNESKAKITLPVRFWTY